MLQRRAIANIQTRIAFIERSTALHEAQQFRERADLLDAMDLHVFDPLAALTAIHPYDVHIATLHARALVLQHTLTSKNEQFCNHLRSKIAAGSYDRAELLQTFIRNSAPHLHDDLQYDSLDVLVNGIVRAEAPPEEPAVLAREMVGYQPTPARLILDLIQHAQLDHTDVLYDLGSGLGHVAIVVALLSAARTVGVEIDAGYCAYARRCAFLLHLDQVTFRNADARTADVSDGTFFYLYTPFHGNILQTVLGRLRNEAEQRPIRMCTYGPCTATIAQQPWLTRVDPELFPHSPLAFFRSRL